MISRELAGLAVAEGCDLGRAEVITGLGFAVVGAGLGVLLLAGSAFGLLSPDGVLHPVITTPAVPSAPARSVRRSTAPSSRPKSIPRLRRPYCPDASSQPRRPLPPAGRVAAARPRRWRARKPRVDFGS
jgi:hypothetical protein